MQSSKPTEFILRKLGPSSPLAVHWQMPTTPAAQIALSHRPKPPVPHSGQMDSKYPRNKVKERERHRKSSLLYIGEIALCAGSRCNIQNVEPRKEGTEGGDPLRSKVANKPEKKKDGKRFLTQEAFFCKYHANRQLASLKRTPINNRSDDTPGIPAQGLRAQGKRNQNAFWRFRIFGTLVITFDFFCLFCFLQFIKENKVTHCLGRKEGAHTTDSRGG